MTGTATKAIQGIRFESAAHHRIAALPAGAEVRITRRGPMWVARSGDFFSGRMTWDALNAAVAVN